MKILHVTSGNLFGGIEAMLVTQARFAGLEPGLVQEFAVGFEGRLEADLLAAGAVVHRYDPPRMSRPWTVLRARRQLGLRIGQIGADVLVTHSNWPHLMFGSVARRKEIGLAFWLHDSFNGGSFIDRLAGLTRPDLVIANSRFNGELSVAKQFPGVPWEVNISASTAPMIADREAVRSRIRHELGSSDESVVVVQTSRLERWKGHAQLLDAAAMLRDKPGWEVWFTGGIQRPHERKFFAELQAAAGAAGIVERVKFLGQRSDIPEVLAAADIHCQANTHPEPLGLTFIEALYSGLPSVSMRMGGAAEIISEACGVLVPPGDIDALAKALASLIDDPSKRARLGAAGPARAAELSDPGLHLARLRRMLEPLTGRRARPPAEILSAGSPDT